MRDRTLGSLDLVGRHFLEIHGLKKFTLRYRHRGIEFDFLFLLLFFFLIGLVFLLLAQRFLQSAKGLFFGGGFFTAVD